MSSSSSRKPIEIKISTVVAISAILHSSNPVQWEASLKEMTGGMSDFFDHEFAVIDLGALDLHTVTEVEAVNAIDWSTLITLFKAHKLNPVAVRNAPACMHDSILANGLSLDTTATAYIDQDQSSDVEDKPATKVTTTEIVPETAQQEDTTANTTMLKEVAPGTMIIDTPVRAGQRIYARGADLIVTAAVNNGAEVIADGSIHVYAPLRGRALAGASGHTGARIFALSLEAELISIAGMYRTFDDGLPQELAQQAVQVSLVGDRLDMTPIQAPHLHHPHHSNSKN
jgi:septum site-determining protein MinC